MRTKVDRSNFIIDRTEILNAKRLVIFRDHQIMPLILKKNDTNDFDDLTILITMRAEKGIVEQKVIFNSNDPFSSWNQSFDDHGLLIDPTDEEIDEIIRLRLDSGMEFGDYDIMTCPDKYLPPALLEWKRQLVAKDVEKGIKRTEEEIERLTEKLEELKSKIIPTE